MDTPRRPPQGVGFSNTDSMLSSAPPAKSTDKFSGALLVASALIAVIRLRGEDIRPSPKVQRIISDSVTLAPEVLREIQRG